MTLLPVADGARLLGIHPKTLHHWLKEANLPLATHPTDARVKCVTEEHLQQIASLHERPLQASGPLDAVSPPLVPSQVSVPLCLKTRWRLLPQPVRSSLLLDLKQV
jgi:hypothetical protein